MSLWHISDISEGVGGFSIWEKASSNHLTKLGKNRATCGKMIITAIVTQ